MLLPGHGARVTIGQKRGSMLELYSKDGTMKARILLLGAALALLSSLAFGMAKNSKKAQVEGVLEIYGNAPFPRLGLKTADGTLYYLDAKIDQKDALAALHGNAVQVIGILSDEGAPVDMAGAIALRVKEWKKL